MAQSIKKPSDVPKEIEKIIEAKEEEIPELQKLANSKDVVLLGFIASYVPRRYTPTARGSATMTLIDEFSIETALTALKKKIPNLNKKKAYMLVNSGGGSLSSAYKIASVIRDSFKDITVFVPHYALSGGTLLALTGNRIRMGMMSQLSALDVQVPYNESQVSVNSLLRARKKLNDAFQTKTVDDLPYPYRHLVESLDPIIIEEWTGIQEEITLYVKEILQKTGYTKEEIDKLVEKMIFSLPTHGFVLRYQHAIELGLKVESDDVDTHEWELMRRWLSEYIVKEADRHFIRYVIPKKNNKNSNKTPKQKKTR